MKKNIILLFAVFMFLLNACNKKSFDYDLYEASVSDIDSIGLSTGAYSLIADGNAKLNFFVDAYRSVKFKGDDHNVMTLINPKSLPEGVISVVDENMSDVGMNFSTTDMGTGTKSFTAKIGNLSSIAHDVTLRPQPAQYQKLYVDVIFHICELSPNDADYDPVSYKKVDPAKLQGALDELNRIFNNQFGDGPNGGSTNIEFRLATHKGSTPLDIPGYHKVVYDNSWIGPPAYSWYPPRTYYYVSDFYDKFDSAPSTYIWDPTQYLNVFVLPVGSNTALPSSSPKYQIVPEGQVAMPGMGTKITSKEVADIQITSKFCGVATGRTVWFRGEESTRIEIAGFIGRSYGVRETSYGQTINDDYCTDTRRYQKITGNADNYYKLIKTDQFGNKFKANNVMDDLQSPSLRNTFTVDQVKRIRYAIENCPGKMHGKTE